MDRGSVMSLITELCKKQLKDVEPSYSAESHKRTARTIRNSRNAAFEILLKHSASHISNDDNGDDETLLPVLRLMACSYEFHKKRMFSAAKHLDSCISKIQTQMSSNPDIEAVVRLILSLADEGPSEGSTTQKQFGIVSYKADAAELDCNVGQGLYRQFSPSTFEPPSILDESLMSEPYKTLPFIMNRGDIPFGSEPYTGLQFLSRFGRTHREVPRTGRKLWDTDCLLTIPELTSSPRELAVPRKVCQVDQVEDEGYVSPSLENSYAGSNASDCWLDIDKVELPKCRNWETFGKLNPAKEDPFLMESGSETVHKMWKLEKKQQRLQNPEKNINLSLRRISIKDLCRDLQFLLVGVESCTFQYDQESQRFVLREGTCTDGLSPESLVNFSRDFILCGTCCRRLQNMVCLTPYVTPVRRRGLIFQAMCDSLRRYLHYFRGFVLSITKKHSLVEWHRRIQVIKIQLVALVKLCKLDDETESSISEGVNLLIYIYEEAMRVTKMDIAHILYSILRSCCHVYFRFLEKWIFQGILNDHYGEFFVRARPEYIVCESRRYWTRGFEIIHNVPAFLSGLENMIFQCGKSVHLLKLCCPKDPLCLILLNSYPKIPCCMRNSDLQNLVSDCEEYFAQVSDHCGPDFAVANFVTQSKQHDKEFYKMIQEVQQKRLKQIQMERQSLQHALIAKKQVQLAELREQIELSAAKKSQEKQTELEEHQKMMQELQRIKDREEQEKANEKQELRKYYGALSDLAEKRKQKAEWKLRRQKLRDKRLELFAQDYLELQKMCDKAGSNVCGDNLTDENASEYKFESTQNKDNTEIVDMQLGDVNSNIIIDSDTSQAARGISDSVGDEELDITNANLLAERSDPTKIKASFEQNVQDTSAAKDQDKICNIQDNVNTVTKLAEKSLQIGVCKTETSISRPEPCDITAKKNRHKVWQEEYGISAPLPKYDATEVKDNIHSMGDRAEKIVVDAQKTESSVSKSEPCNLTAVSIRRKVWQEEYGVITPYPKSDVTEVVTDAQKTASVPRLESCNLTAASVRRKVWQEEYGVITPYPKCDVTEVKGNINDIDKLGHVQTGVQRTKLSISMAESSNITAERIRRKVWQEEYGVITPFPKYDVTEIKSTVGEMSKDTRKNKSSENILGDVSEKDDAVVIADECDVCHKGEENVGSMQSSTENMHGSCSTSSISSTQTSPTHMSHSSSSYKTVSGDVSMKSASSDKVTSEMSVASEVHGSNGQDTWTNSQSGAQVEKIFNTKSDELSSSMTDSKSFPEGSVISSVYSNLDPLDEPAPDTKFNFTVKRSRGNISYDSNFHFDPSVSGHVPVVDVADKVTTPVQENVLTRSDIEAIDMTSLSVSLRKSVLIPLETQAHLVNRSILKYFLVEQHLLDHLHSLRNYFFLNDGVFGRHVADGLFEKVYRVSSPAELLNCVTLYSILKKAVTASINSNDPNVERLSFSICFIPQTLQYSDANVLECVQLCYNVTWPLNIIITEECLKKYNEVFWFLLKLRRASWTLEAIFHCLKTPGADVDMKLFQKSPEYHKIQLFRHEMQHFIHGLQNYVASTVLQVSWAEFEHDLKGANTLDDLYAMHVRYIKKVIFRCLLKKQSAVVMQALNNVFAIILRFHYHLKSHPWKKNDSTNQYEHPCYKRITKIFSSFKENSDFLLKVVWKLAVKGYQPHLYELLQMLNMNDYYKLT